jgi:hypothetical protein
MIDEDSDWISFEDAVAYVEATQQCHREKAVELVWQAASDLKLRSRTVESSPRWIESVIAGVKVYHSDCGQRVEVCRKDVVQFFLELQHTTTRSSPGKSKSALWNNVTSAIADLWSDKEITVRPKDRNKKIHEWLISREIISKFEDVTRTIQRVLREQRKGPR